jgi:hypothetical protein
MHVFRVCLAVLGILAAIAIREVAAQSSEMVYFTVPPCRIVDTRLAGGPIAAGTIRDFHVKGTSGFSGQGGNSSGCGIPTTAEAAMVNIVAVNPAGAGDLRAWAFSQPVPASSVLNYAVISGLNIANGIALPVCVGSCSFDLKIQADVSATDVLVDIVGYFAPGSPIHSIAACDTGNSGIACSALCQPGKCISGTQGGGGFSCTMTSDTGSCSAGSPTLPSRCAVCMP